MSGLIGLKSIAVVLDGQPLRTVQFGETLVLDVPPGQHAIQTKLVSRSFATLFITVTRTSKALNVTVAPDTQLSIMGKYSRAYGNIELQGCP
jgi:hypothetical protein